MSHLRKITVADSGLIEEVDVYVANLIPAMIQSAMTAVLAAVAALLKNPEIWNPPCDQ